MDRQTKYGNPFIVGVHGVRGECCDKHKQWLLTGESFGNPQATKELRLWVLDNIYHLLGENLLCWCAPERCHAETLAWLAHQPVEYINTLRRLIV